MQEALANGSPAAQASEFVVYPDTPHAFHADYRPSYRKAAADDGWRCLAWFKARRGCDRPAKVGDSRGLHRGLPCATP